MSDMMDSELREKTKLEKIEDVVSAMEEMSEHYKEIWKNVFRVVVISIF